MLFDNEIHEVVNPHCYEFNKEVNGDDGINRYKLNRLVV